MPPTREQLLRAAEQRRLEELEYAEMVEWIETNGTELLKKCLRLLHRNSSATHQRYLWERFRTKRVY